jgi:hypothetical protein
MASKHRNETPAARIMRLIRTAFQAAQIGEEGKARSLMASALKAGATLDDRTSTGFEFAIAKGLRDTRK